MQHVTFAKGSLTPKDYYENNAKGKIFEQFAQIAEPYKTEYINLLQKHLTEIIKEIKSIAQPIT